LVVMESSRNFGSFLAVGAIFLASSAALADVKAGVDAWAAGDYKAAIGEWQGPAQRGDPDAQFNLAQAYKLGRGVEQDLAKAETQYRMAADKGHLQAADNYGLLLFQRGERANAMPYIIAASDRGDPRAQYILGLAHFNGDVAPKDWVRGYALVSLAHQAGLPQAIPALKQMDEFIPLEQRQASVPLAAELRVKANTLQASEAAARDLGTPPRPPATASPATAGADFTLPPSPPAVTTPSPKGWIEVPPPAPGPVAQPPSPAPAPASIAKPAPAPRPAPAAAPQGPWRVQLGAFGVRGNAERLWSQIGSRSELAGKRKILVPAGQLTKLQAGGFASEAQATSACGKLKAAGHACLVVKD